MLGHLCQLVLDRLELAQRTAELLALIGVLQRHLQHALQGAGHLRGKHGSLHHADIWRLGAFNVWIGRLHPFKPDTGIGPLDAALRRPGPQEHGFSQRQWHHKPATQLKQGEGLRQ